MTLSTTPLAATALLLLLPAQGVSEAPEAADLLARYEAAIGDRERIDGLENVVQHGKATWDGIEGDGIVVETFGGFGRARSVTEFGAFGSFELGTNGAFVWEDNPIGTTIRLGWDASQYLREYGMLQYVDWNKLYRSASTSGLAKVEELGGRECWVLQLFPRALVELEGEDAKRIPPPDTLYLDPETYLPRRFEARSIGMLDEPVTRKLDFDDWRAVDGIQRPHTVRLEVSGFKLTLRYTAFEHDVPLPDGFFEPSERVLEALEKERSGEREREDDAIVVEELETRHIASIRVTSEYKDMQRTLSVLLPEVFEHVTTSGAGMTGPPLVRYHKWGDPVDLEAAIPLAKPIEAVGRMKPQTLPKGKAIIAWHVGPYEQLGETHERIQAFMEAQGLERRAAPWEEYWTDPGMEPNPSKWRTRVVWPVRPVQ